MTQNVGRTLHWFWPRAESVLYAEIKRLSERGLAAKSKEPGSRGRDRAIYSITDEGRRALRDWLGTEPAPFVLHFESLLRVHLSPYGTKADLINSLEQAKTDAETLLKQALIIGGEFASGTHQFQEQVHVRTILFDYLWNFGLGMYEWATRSLEEVHSWRSIAGSSEARVRAQERLQVLLDSWTVSTG